MKTLMECRFMQTAMSDMPCCLTTEELQAEFNQFQTALLDLLDGGNDYRKIDFVLHDTLSIVEQFFLMQKKMNDYCVFLFHVQSPICVHVLLKTINALQIPNFSYPYVRLKSHRCIGSASPSIWPSCWSMPLISEHSAMHRSQRSYVNTNGFTTSSWERRAT